MFEKGLHLCWAKARIFWFKLSHEKILLEGVLAGKKRSRSLTDLFGAMVAGT